MNQKAASPFYQHQQGAVGQRVAHHRAEDVVGQQPLCDPGNQDRIADVRVAAADPLDRQVVGQVAEADDFDAVVEDEQSDRSVHKIIAQT